MAKTLTATVLDRTGNSGYHTLRVVCGTKVYTVEVTCDCCEKTNPDRAYSVLVWGATKLSTARRNALGLASTEWLAKHTAEHAARCYYEPRPLCFTYIEAGGSMVDYRHYHR